MLGTIQRRAARFVTRDYHRTTSVAGLLSRLEWRTLEERRRRARLTLLLPQCDTRVGFLLCNIYRYRYSVEDKRSSYVEGILLNESGSDISFTLQNTRKEQVGVVWVYDCQGGGDYIQCAIKSICISDVQLLRNAIETL